MNTSPLNHPPPLHLQSSNDKRPRHYAAEIVALPSRLQRRAALQQVPAHYRDWVRNLVSQTFHRQSFQRRALPQQTDQRRQ